MGRKNRSRKASARLQRGARRGRPGAGRRGPGGASPGIPGRGDAEVWWLGQPWGVRQLRAASPGCTGKAYRCPGCDQEFAGVLAHVLVWPADAREGISARRHWHGPCWQARERRPPRGSYL